MDISDPTDHTCSMKHTLIYDTLPDYTARNKNNFNIIAGYLIGKDKKYHNIP